MGNLPQENQFLGRNSAWTPPSGTGGRMRSKINIILTLVHQLIHQTKGLDMRKPIKIILMTVSS